MGKHPSEAYDSGYLVRAGEEVVGRASSDRGVTG
jgi:hypothetical protein